MKITKKIENEILKVMDGYWNSYLEGDLERWASFLPDDYKNIGTTKVEIWNSKREVVDFTEEILAQTVGMAQIRDKKSQIIPYDPYVMVHEIGDIYVKAEEGWIFYAEVRLSSLLQNTKVGWKILHQHGSYPDSKTQEGEAFGFDELRVENKKLKDAIQRRTIELERKNRDLEIEAAVEKVRTEAMSMQSTNDFEKVTKQLLKQVQYLNIEGFTGASIGFIDDNHFMSWWDFSSPGNFTDPKSQISQYDAKKYKLLGKEVLDAWLEGDDYHVFYYDLERLKAAILEWERINMDVANAFRQSITEGKLTQQWNPWGRFSDGLLAFDMIRPPDDEVRKITIKMTLAFEQAYIRFQDLKNAEAQAREAKIEAALETIRSRSLSVTRSEEFNDVVKVVFEKLDYLQIPVSSVTIGTKPFDSEKQVVYGCGEGEAGLATLQFTLPYFSNAFTNDLIEEQHKSESGYMSRVYSEADKNHYYDFVFEHTELKHLPEDLKDKVRQSKSYGLSTAFARNSSIMVNDFEGNILDEQQANTLKRFSTVFEQAYIRFLDLQKAEAQAREAQIEAALERTRAQSMMMQHSEELTKTSEVFHEQLCRLGIEAEFSYLWLPDEEHSEHLFWATWREKKNGKTIFNNKQVVYPLDKTEPSIAECYVAWGSGLPVHINPVKPEGVKDYFDTWQELLEGVEKFKAENFPGGLYYIDAYMKYGCFGIMIKDTISEDDERVLERFSKEFERTYTRFLDLQKAEAQAREAKIETALEKVRSRSLAMHQSEELGEVITTVVEQLKSLDFSVNDGVALITYIEGSKDLVEWMENPGFPSAIKFMLPYFDHPVLSDLWDAKENGKKYIATRYSPEESRSFLHHIYKYSDFRDTPQEVKDYTLAAKTYGYTIAFQQHTAIFINDYSGYALTEAEIDVLLRFSRVFEQAYIRFLDLQKAETQAREAEIELSLERIRAKTMAMHSSQELAHVVATLYKELNHMKMGDWGCNIMIFNEAKDQIEIWLAESEDRVFPDSFKYRTKDEEFIQKQWEIWETQIDENITLKDKEKKSYDDFILSKTDFKNLPQEVKNQIRSLNEIHFSFSTMKYGMLAVIDSARVLNNDEKFILNRFAQVFEQTYTRFLDLKKAEAQAREAQIEASLEKVRSRTMAMHKAEELKDVVTLVVEKLTELGVILDANGAILCTYFEDSKDVLHWAASSDFSFAGSYLLPYFEHPIFRSAWESRLRGDEYFSESFTVEEKNSFYEYAFEYSDYKYFPDEFKEWIFQNDKHSLSFAWTENAAILIPSHTGVVPEGQDIDILKRFARVFEAAYVRFMDLQKAEKAARETKIELSLEKIRALVTSMQESSDLLDIMVAIRREFVSLGYEAHYFWYMRWLPDVYEKAMTSGDGTKIGNVLKLPRKIHGEIKNIAEWEKGNDPTIIHVMDPEAAIDYVHKMIHWGDFEQVDHNVPSDDLLREIGGLTYVMARTSQGEIGYSLPGMVPHPPQEAVDTLVRFAGVFDLAYTRFEDLKESELQSLKLMEEKNRLEQAFSDLKAAQAQLIQAEKMASLGELTAGIAHEIQNPLNFVNNFSEVSSEILDEINEELEVGDLDEVKAILADLKNNLEKITHHGHRASGIVKSMLDHSRTSSGEKVETDINALCDEYLRLAYHGMRAKDRNFNSDFKINTDEKLPKIKVIQQDFGRVLLNLVNNSFQAVNEKSKSPTIEKDYKPLVTVTTHLMENELRITVSDNGPGIPDEIREKVFQPFFTTKPTGQGTGLGLSLSYDIIKTHGGKIFVESKEDEGTKFTILLPIV